MVDPKELYEHLEVLLLATEGTSAEPSLDYVVDALRRAASAHSFASCREMCAVYAALCRWQRAYRPTNAELAARGAAVKPSDPVRSCHES